MSTSLIFNWESILESIAIKTYDSKCSFETLSVYTHTLKFNVSSQKRIGVFIPNGTDLCASILSILVSGTYVSLPTKYPPKRLKDIIEQTNVDEIWTNESNQVDLTKVLSFLNCSVNIKIVSQHNIDESDRQNAPTIFEIIPSNNIAYIVHTSGSTGRPKSIGISYNSLCHMIHVGQSTPIAILSTDCVLQSYQTTFDPHVWTIVCSLFAKASLYCPSTEEIMKPHLAFNIFKENQVTYVCGVPSLFQVWGDVLSSLSHNNLNIRVCSSVGDLLRHNVMCNWFKYTAVNSFLNTYGPAECTVYSTYFDYTREMYDMDMYKSTNFDWTSPVPIGIPLPGYEIKNVDTELWIGGPCVMEGYISREGFVKTDSLQIDTDGNKWYKTGDVVHIIDCNLMFLGRKDFQIKIHGQRIELKEIESVFLQLDNVTNVVICKKDEHTLIGFVESKKKCLDWKEHCERQLPSYMVPSHVVVLETFPTNTNGKIDRDMLMKLSMEHSQTLQCDGKEESNDSDNIDSDSISNQITDWFSSQLDIKINKKSLTKMPLASLGFHSLHMMRLFHFVHINYNINIDVKNWTNETCIRDVVKIVQCEIENPNYSSCIIIEKSTPTTPVDYFFSKIFETDEYSINLSTKDCTDESSSKLINSFLCVAKEYNIDITFLSSERYNEIQNGSRFLKESKICQDLSICIDQNIDKFKISYNHSSYDGFSINQLLFHVYEKFVGKILCIDSIENIWNWNVSPNISFPHMYDPIQLEKSDKINSKIKKFIISVDISVIKELSLKYTISEPSARLLYFLLEIGKNQNIEELSNLETIQIKQVLDIRSVLGLSINSCRNAHVYRPAFKANFFTLSDSEILEFWKHNFEHPPSPVECAKLLNYDIIYKNTEFTMIYNDTLIFDQNKIFTRISKDEMTPIDHSMTIVLSKSNKCIQYTCTMII